MSLNQDKIAERTGKIIREEAPITVRALKRRFDTSAREYVQFLVNDWYRRSMLKLSGTGVPGSPITIRRLDQ